LLELERLKSCLYRLISKFHIINAIEEFTSTITEKENANSDIGINISSCTGYRLAAQLFHLKYKLLVSNFKLNVLFQEKTSRRSMERLLVVGLGMWISRKAIILNNTSQGDLLQPDFVGSFVGRGRAISMAPSDHNNRHRRQ
jgi:hypothetical protein